MKKMLVVGIVVALVIGALAAPALADIRIKGGWFMPTDKEDNGPYGTFPEDGIFFGAEMVSTLGDTLGLGIGADYFQSNQTLENVGLPLEALNASYRVIPISATAYLYPTSGLYIGAGIGYYLANVTVGEESEDKSGFGYHGVAGYQITDLIFVEGRYSTCTISDWGGWDAGGISIAAGLSF